MADITLLKIDELSKPATILIEKISDAIGAVFLPHQIKRIAVAEAEADKIRALSQIDISDIQRRALIRMVQEEGKKQENIESISAKAIKILEPTANPEKIDNDWLSNFFDKCRLVSDQEMQSLWSRILAGEANHSGSFSKRTIELVSTLDKSDANLFTSLCGFGWMISIITPLVFDTENDIYKNQGITFEALTHLENLGLLRFEPVSYYERKGFSKIATVFYYGAPITLEFKNDTKNILKVGIVHLSQAGQELALICGSKKIDNFPEYVVGKWVENGIVAYSAWPKKTAKAANSVPVTDVR
jgi:hypothetical protein